MGNSSSKNKRSKRQAATRGIQVEQYPPSQRPYQPDYRKPQPAYEPDYRTPQPSSDTYYETQEEQYLERDIFDVDSCIYKLLKVGKTRTINRTFCLTQSEVISICKYAYQLFLSQPVPFFFYYLFIKSFYLFTEV